MPRQTIRYMMMTIVVLLFASLGASPILAVGNPTPPPNPPGVIVDPSSVTGEMYSISPIEVDQQESEKLWMQTIRNSP